MEKSTKKPICCGEEMYASGGLFGLLPDGSEGDLVHIYRCGVCQRELREILHEKIVANYVCVWKINHKWELLGKEVEFLGTSGEDNRIHKFVIDTSMYYKLKDFNDESYDLLKCDGKPVKKAFIYSNFIVNTTDPMHCEIVIM